MIRFVYQGQHTDRDVLAHAHAIGPTAVEIANWPAQTTTTIKQTSETTWVVMAQNETVTAELVQ